MRKITDDIYEHLYVRFQVFLFVMKCVNEKVWDKSIASIKKTPHTCCGVSKWKRQKFLCVYYSNVKEVIYN